MMHPVLLHCQSVALSHYAQGHYALELIMQEYARITYARSPGFSLIKEYVLLFQVMVETVLSKFEGKSFWLKLDYYTDVEIGVFGSILLVLQRLLALDWR